MAFIEINWTYKTLRVEYHQRWQAQLRRDREAAGGKNGPNPRVLKQFYLGNALLEVVRRTVRENSLTHTKAAALLGSKPGAVEPILKQYEAKRGSYVSKAWFLRIQRRYRRLMYLSGPSHLQVNRRIRLGELGLIEMAQGC